MLLADKNNAQHPQLSLSKPQRLLVASDKEIRQSSSIDRIFPFAVLVRCALFRLSGPSYAHCSSFFFQLSDPARCGDLGIVEIRVGPSSTVDKCQSAAKGQGGKSWERDANEPEGEANDAKNKRE